jgi:hypothetical protein
MRRKILGETTFNIDTTTFYVFNLYNLTAWHFKVLTINNEVICPSLDNSQTHIKKTTAVFTKYIQ